MITGKADSEGNSVPPVAAAVAGPAESVSWWRAEWRKTSERNGVFSPTDELVNQALGIGFLALAIGALLVSHQAGPLETHYERVLVHGVFLNYVHVGFTFAMISQVPSLRKLLADGKRPRGLGPRGLAAATLVTALWAAHLSGLWNLHGLGLSLGPREFEASWVLYSLWGIFHFQAQTRGISALYSKRNLPEASVARAERTERYAFKALFLFIALGRGLYFFGMPVSLWWVTFYGALAAAAAAFLNSFRFKNPLKTGFVIRAFAYPLAELDVGLFLVVQALHGTEYFFVSRKILSNVLVKKIAGIGLFALALGAVIFVVQIVHDEWGYYGFTGRAALLFPWVYASVILLASMHYYLDGLIFRFRNPAVQEYVSPLFSKPSSTWGSRAYPSPRGFP